MKKSNNTKIKEEGILYLVATPIGNLSDITYRAIDTLKSVDYIIAEDTRQTNKLLKHFEITKKCISYHKYNENERLEQILKNIYSGNNIALVSDAGTPAISDPGEIIVKKCIENGIKIVPIPGAVALINAVISSGMDTSKFVFEGFIPFEKKQRKEILKNIENENRTIIIYEAPHKLKKLLKDLYDTVGNRKICICRELTKIYEEFYRTDLESAINYYNSNNPRGEFVLVIEGKKDDKKDIVNIEEIKEFAMKEYDILIDKIDDGKEAMKKIADKYNIKKNQLYKWVLELKKKGK